MIEFALEDLRKKVFTAAWLSLFLTGFGIHSAIPQEARSLTLFAAASTTDAITDIAARFEKSHAAKVQLSFASSSTLARQIENGAPADIFLSADIQWMDYLSDKGALVSSSRLNLLGNRIVLIAPENSSLSLITIDSALDLPGLLGKDGRLSMGDPAHVPAGIYGKQALESLGLWHAVAERIAPAKDVSAALVLVERGESPLGLVYATDAAVSQKVKIVGTFSEDSHPPIVYPVGMIRKTELAGQFMSFLKSETAAGIFRRYGFTIR